MPGLCESGQEIREFFRGTADAEETKRRVGNPERLEPGGITGSLRRSGDEPRNALAAVVPFTKRRSSKRNESESGQVFDWDGRRLPRIDCSINLRRMRL